MIVLCENIVTHFPNSQTLLKNNDSDNVSIVTNCSSSVDTSDQSISSVCNSANSVLSKNSANVQLTMIPSDANGSSILSPTTPSTYQPSPSVSPENVPSRTTSPESAYNSSICSEMRALSPNPSELKNRASDMNPFKFDDVRKTVADQSIRNSPTDANYQRNVHSPLFHDAKESAQAKVYARRNSHNPLPQDDRNSSSLSFSTSNVQRSHSIHVHQQSENNTAGVKMYVRRNSHSPLIKDEFDDLATSPTFRDSTTEREAPGRASVRRHASMNDIRRLSYTKLFRDNVGATIRNSTYANDNDDHKSRGIKRHVSMYDSRSRNSERSLESSRGYSMFDVHNRNYVQTSSNDDEYNRRRNSIHVDFDRNLQTQQRDHYRSAVDLRSKNERNSLHSQNYYDLINKNSLPRDLSKKTGRFQNQTSYNENFSTHDLLNLNQAPTQNQNYYEYDAELSKKNNQSLQRQETYTVNRAEQFSKNLARNSYDSSEKGFVPVINPAREEYLKNKNNIQSIEYGTYNAEISGIQRQALNQQSTDNFAQKRHSVQYSGQNELLKNKRHSLQDYQNQQGNFQYVNENNNKNSAQMGQNFINKAQPVMECTDKPYSQFTIEDVANNSDLIHSHGISPAAVPKRPPRQRDQRRLLNVGQRRDDVRLESEKDEEYEEDGLRRFLIQTQDERQDYNLNNNSCVSAVTIKESKQRASVKWLLSKAFNNKVPENLKEPFYRDHENQEHLKPQIIGALANAELYCLALGHIYSDPNYHNLNHWAILQTLARKGVYAQEDPSAQLTETVLIQTNPLRMNAHMAVIESIMTLYAKEVASADQITAAVKRIGGHTTSVDIAADPERGLVCWVNSACRALSQRIQQELASTDGGGAEGDRHRAPPIPNVTQLSDLCDGVTLAALLSFYCPDELPWTDIIVSRGPPSVSDSLHNLALVRAFCQRNLPHCTVFHMMPEDITYMRGSMKQNLIVFLADLFNVLEIHPVKCVRYSGIDRPSSVGRNSQGVAHKRNLPPTVVTPIPDLRSGLDASPQLNAFTVPRTPATVTLKKTAIHASDSQFSEDSLFTRRDSEESFVVHHNRGVPTLTSVVSADEPLLPARLRPAKEKQNNDSKADERGDGKQTAAGRPSNWEDSKKNSYAGRRSRRNSFSDESQLTIENFGGSQENLSFIGRNPDKDFAVHTGRKTSAPEPSVPTRSSIQDARGSIQITYEDNEKQDTEREKGDKSRRGSTEALTYRHLSAKEDGFVRDMVDGEMNNKMASFADLSKTKFGDQRGIHIVYMQHEKGDGSGDRMLPSKSSLMSKNTNGTGEKKTTTFATLPNTTTWQQQSSSNQQQQNVSASSGSPDDVNASGNVMASQLNNIRLKLEEKRRHIESEKRKMELVMNTQRQKVGKAAFLQAVSKNKLKSTEDGDTSATQSAAPTETQQIQLQQSQQTDKPQRPFTLKEISEDAMTVEHKWLEADGGAPFVETRKTPDIENMDLEQYQQSLAMMNHSLHDIQADIQRLASQQNQIQATQHQNMLAAVQQHHQQQMALAAQQQRHYASQHNINTQQHVPQLHHVFGSAQHIPQMTNNVVSSEPQQFYLHEQPNVQQTQRRTWSQQAPVSLAPMQQTRTYPSSQQQDLKTWGSKPQTYSQQHDARYQNGDQNTSYSNSHYNSYQQQPQAPMYMNAPSSISSSPQHRNASVHRQISNLMSDALDDRPRGPVNLQQLELQDRTLNRSQSAIHHLGQPSTASGAPVPMPSVDDMEPQNISFIGNSDDALSEGLNKLNITSGSRTYRIPSPTRPSISRNSFHQQQQRDITESPNLGQPKSPAPSSEPNTSEKGFYISFDNEQPKRPKPPLRVKRSSPKKERTFTEDDVIVPKRAEQSLSENERQIYRNLGGREPLERVPQKHEEKQTLSERYRQESSETGAQQKTPIADRRSTSRDKSPSAIVIPNDSPDPNSLDEMERKKERIMLLSLQRRQQQEEAKARKEAESAARREREKAKEEERLRKREEQAQRRAAILEQYKLKKAIEEAEREGKILDRSELMGSMKPAAAKLRGKHSTGRPRPKTIHIDSGSVEMAEGMLTPSRGKKGSTSNLTANTYNPSSMRRDYYRGSHDSLADAGALHRDSPDDGRGASPCRSANQTLGRRASYKTSRENVHEAGQVRGRPKYPTYQNFRAGRKSNSMMNLCGSSSDQDSMVYRYGDTDSGLGRATPPRRAPSPGMGPMRHLPSPSGPGSLPPGLMTKRRVFDDGCSDISSTPSSMMDYSGPRLYKQPATKSNRGIMLNAVEYCVFPGVVNRDAKRRVLEEIARSESKHFLILFRDAGCQFRALYSYCPDREEVSKLYGTGPKQVNDRMFDKFFKYNSGGKCFSQVHTKHLTVTIDAFTIHNSLWQGKKVNLPNKKDMALVI